MFTVRTTLWYVYESSATVTGSLAVRHTHVAEPREVDER